MVQNRFTAGLNVSHGRNGAVGKWTPKAPIYLPLPKLAKHLRFTLARYVSLNSLTLTLIAGHQISAFLLTQSFHLVASRTFWNLRKSRAIVVSLSYKSPAAFMLDHPLCHRTRRGQLWCYWKRRGETDWISMLLLLAERKQHCACSAPTVTQNAVSWLAVFSVWSPKGSDITPNTIIK